MTATLYLRGLHVTPEQLDDVVDGFRTASDVVAGLVLPWDRAADAGALHRPASAARTGTLWSRTAECRWRVESDRALVTILADEELGGMGLDQLDAEHEDQGEIRWVHRPFVIGGASLMFQPRLYLVDGAPAHRRVFCEEA
jgi:hypothetical protein